MSKEKPDNLKAFLRPIVREKIEYVASKDFKDDAGNPIPWVIRPISSEENDALIKECTKNRPVPGKKGMFSPETDYSLYSRKLSVACTEFPPLDSVELQDAHGVMGALALFAKLLYEGEQAAYSAKVREVNRFDNDFEEAVDDAKN